MLTKREIQQFVSRIWNNSHIQIIISDYNLEKICRWMKAHDLDKIKKLLADFKKQTGINEFSLVDERVQSKKAVWLQQKIKRVVINFFYIKNITELEVGLSDLAKEIKENEKRVIKEAELIKAVSEKAAVPRTVEPPKIEEKEEVPKKELLLELGRGFWFCLPDSGDLKVRRDPNNLLLKKEDGNILFIWFRGWLKEWRESPEVVIGERTYKLKENTIVEIKDEFEWVNGHLVPEEIEDKEFPLKKGKGGEKIIDLSVIKENSELDRFLRR